MGTDQRAYLTATREIEMPTLDYRSLARAYVEASCAHDPDAIRLMLAESATYRSSNVGYYERRDPIMEMMTGFYASFPDVVWTVDEYRLTAEGVVAFDFVMCGTHHETGERLEKQGRETIEFQADGLIRHIEVDTK